MERLFLYSSLVFGVLAASCGGESDPAEVPAATLTEREPTTATPSTVPDPAEPVIDDPSTWTQLRSTRLGFSIRMPALDEPRDLERADDLNLYSRPEGMDGPWFSVFVHPTYREPHELRSSRDIDRFLEQEADVAVGHDPWGRPNYLGGSAEELYGRPGYATTEVVNEPYPGSRLGSIRTRVVLVGERVFVLQVRARGPRPAPDVVDAFFSSFELADGATPATP